MRGARGWGRGAVAVIVGVALALALACTSLTPEPGSVSSGLIGRCQKGSVPCGNGCMPQDAACCDDGTRRTSDYCPNTAGGGCRPNTNKACKTPAPELRVTDFCCASNTEEGSLDCPRGQHHCGSFACVADGKPCCEANALGVDCPFAADSTGCPNRDGVLCGVKAGTCTTCPLGFCCAGDPLEEGGFRCLPPTGVCTGTKGGGSSGSSSSSGSSGGGTCRLVWDCGSSSQCASVYGAKSGSAAEPDAATCNRVCKAQGACTCQGC